MPLSGHIDTTPGVQLDESTLITNDILNQGFTPTSRLGEGAISSRELSQGLSFEKFTDGQDFNDKIADKNITVAKLSSEDQAAGNLVRSDGAGGVEWYDPSAGGNTDEPAVILSGFVVMSAANAIPSGYLDCNGALISRTTYPTLFTAIGTTYGVGDGSTTFALPNMSARFPCAVGVGGSGISTKSLGEVGGKESHVMLDTDLVGHTHNLPFKAFSGQHQNGVQASGVYPMVTGTGDSETGTAGATPPTAMPTVSPYFALRFLIKI